VRPSGDEIARLAAFKKISESDFIQQFTRLRNDRRGLALQDKPNGECTFLEGDDYSVQPGKPQPCRDFGSNLAGAARCAVRATFSGATVSPQTLEKSIPSAERGRGRRSAASLPFEIRKNGDRQDAGPTY